MRIPKPAHPTSWREVALMTQSRPIFPSGSLNAELNAFKAACVREWPSEAFALVNQTLADLAQTGIREAVLKAGDVAPSFTLPDQEGRLVHSQELLAEGRSCWCSIAACGDRTATWSRLLCKARWQK